MIQRIVLSDQVKEELLDDIMSGRYKPGDRLVESQIAKRMGISQSPVREALRDMVAMRFVEVEPHKGARVRKVDEREIMEIYPVRASLEELAGRLAAPHAKPHIGELERAVERMTKSFKVGDARKMAQWDVHFHRTIVEATGNDILIETWGSLMIEARTYVTLSNLMARMPNLDLADWHDPIIVALRDGDPEICGLEMRKHVEAFGRVMDEIFSADLKAGMDAADLPPLDDETVERARAG